MKEYELPNSDGRTTKFTGMQLAHQSSRREPDQLRWTEISLYRTEGGNYIVHKVGRSVVAHRPHNSCSSGAETLVSKLDADALPCPKCEPVLLPKPGVFVVAELDRNTVHVSTTAEGAVESCHTEDDDGTVYLTNAARTALQDAAQADSAIREAFTVQRVE